MLPTSRPRATHTSGSSPRRRYAALQQVASGSSEVTLEEIHDLLEPAIATKSLQGLAAITELQIERENVFADARLVAYLDTLHE